MTDKPGVLARGWWNTTLRVFRHAMRGGPSIPAVVVTREAWERVEADKVAAVAAAVAAERERCVQVVEGSDRDAKRFEIADAIRRMP